MVYVIDVCWQLASRIGKEPVPSRSCSQNVSKLVWHISFLCVEWITPDDGQRNGSKHEGFYSKNKIVKLVNLVGFITRIYHDARSSGRQKKGLMFKPESWRRRLIFLHSVRRTGKEYKNVRSNNLSVVGNWNVCLHVPVHSTITYKKALDSFGRFTVHSILRFN